MNCMDGVDGEESIEIIISDKNKLCVIAGPGTGKTFTLMRRIARLLEDGIDPSKILLVTFTRTSALDMKKELSLLGIEGSDDIVAKTLHSFCFSILNRRNVLEITERKPRTLLDFEKRFLLEDLRDYGLGNIHDLEEKLHAFEAVWARLQSDEPGWPRDINDRRFYNELIEWLIFHDAMIVEEIVPETLKYIRTNPTCEERQMYDYIFVDEFQDLNKAEQKLIELLSDDDSSVMIIGDDDQSIFESFRFAHPEGIQEYITTHSDSYESLDQCRRCPENIVSIATDLISLCHNRVIEKNLISISEETNEKIVIVQWDTLEKEIEGIVNYIKKEIEENDVDIGKILILSPSRHFGYSLRDKLNDFEIKAHSFFKEEQLDGNPKDLELCEEQMAFTLLTLLANPDDKVAIRCWLGFGSNNLLSRSYRNLRIYCIENDETPKNVLDNIINGNLSLTKMKPLIKRYKLLLSELNKLKTFNGEELIDYLFPEDENWSKQFRIILNDLDEESSHKEIFQILRTNIIQPEMPKDVDYVRIMSLHKSKGLTADLVVITSCVDGLIPYRESGLTRERRLRYEDEQRRLFYVGITRSKKTLIISSFAGLPRELAYKTKVRYIVKRGPLFDTIASPFLSELGPSAPDAIRGDNWKH